MKTHAIREAFLHHFQSQGHQVVPSFPLVPQGGDGSLLFVNAGMVPLKPYFLQQANPPSQRLTSAQWCFRASGKHNDFQQVGYTARHHTLFEMLGNFSFGDYFKEEAILMAWSFIRDQLKIPLEHLLVTHYAEDLETRALWQKISGLSDARIVPIATSDNFWSMGPTGPCGPCTEIFYLFDAKAGDDVPLDEKAVEIWNLVFMMYNQKADGSRELLPKPCVDTGMGLERAASVLQGVFDNYRTDTFQTILGNMAQSLDKPIADPYRCFPLRVLADHVRAFCFLSSEGLKAGREGAGYVLRRLIRRMICQAREMQWKPAQTSQALEAGIAGVIQEFSPQYTHLQTSTGFYMEAFEQEAQQFQETLDRGIPLVEEACASLTESLFPGSVAFKLYDTYGFPLDILEDLLQRKNIVLDQTGFQQEMEGQQERARQARSASHRQEQTTWVTSHAGHFCGYTQETCTSVILDLGFNHQSVHRLEKGQEGFLVAEETPFYPESGGQEGDHGWIQGPNGLAQVLDTQKQQKAIVHHIRITEGTVSTGEHVTLQIDTKRRSALRANHSATHLLQSALREILGTHVMQKGSLVSADRLRFDFTHGKPLTIQECEAIEQWMQEHICDNLPVTTEEIAYEVAKTQGALSLGSADYAEKVRVVRMGEASMELCGGTHVMRTGDIGPFQILQETGLASGIRRIEAISRITALNRIQKQSHLVSRLSQHLHVVPEILEDTLLETLETRKKQEKALEKWRQEALLNRLEHTIKSTANQTISCFFLESEGEPQDRLPLFKALRAKYHLKENWLFFVDLSQESVGFVLGAPESLNPKEAQNLAQEMIGQLGGKMGGKGPIFMGGGMLRTALQSWRESQ